MASFSHPHQGRWFHPAGADRFKRAAEQYRAAAEKVEPAAAEAVRTHIIAPAVAAGAHEDTGLFYYRGNVHIGVHPDHPAHAEANDIEYGTEDRPAGGQIRSAIHQHGDETLAAFYREMMT